MRRRHTLQTLLALGLSTAWAARPLHAQTQAETPPTSPPTPSADSADDRAPREGRDYLRLARPAPTDAPAGAVEVIEFFWYACPHCYAFEPLLADWLRRLPAQVAFKRVHVGFRPQFEPQQRLHATLEALGLMGRLHTRVFDAIHRERLALHSEAAILDWVARQGVEREAFSQTWRSFGVTAQITRAQQLMNAYAVQGVPALGVAGRYYIDGELAGPAARMLQVTDALIARSRASTQSLF